MTGTTVTLLTVLMLVAVPLPAQEPAPPAERDGAPAAAADEKPAAPEPDSDASQTNDEEPPPPPPGEAPPIESRGGADDVFVPSEQVRADSSIAFPVDI